ncbi:MAG: cytochrome c-type biogenesis protein CcmH [Candidatus Oxydemutatoraceae bacterium WSBS_2016_MAG_OTU14]
MKKFLNKPFFVVFFALWIHTTHAEAINTEILSPTQLEQYQGLLHELRCLVCQNQSLADSSADLAGDLRQVVFKMVKEGASNDEIYTFMRERYSDFILYNPPFKAKTALLWLAPLLVLLTLLGSLFMYLRKQQRRPS